MAGAISIVLKAIDQYSGVITGLNQGFELVGKSISLVKGAADIAFSAINKGVELAAEGGNYAEMRRQFNTVAESYGRDGQKILDSLDKITQDTIGLSDAARLAGKGIAAGLSESQLSTVFEFIKKQTELTGESFVDLSESVVQAISTGRTSVLKQLGLVIEKGDSVSTVLNKMQKATLLYGDAGFNAADKINALANQQQKFATALGVAVNETPAFQRVLTTVTDAVIKLVSTFDPRPISVWLDFVLGGVESLLKTIIQNVPILGRVWDSLWQGASKGAGEFAKITTNYVFQVVKSVGSAVNQALDYLTDKGIISALEYIGSFAITTFETVSKGIVAIADAIVTGVGSAIEETIVQFKELAEAFPRISSAIGIDTEQLEAARQSVQDMAKGVSDVTDDLYDGIENTGKSLRSMLAGVSDGTQKWRVDLEQVNSVQESIQAELDKIDYSKKWGEFSDAAEVAVKRTQMVFKQTSEGIVGFEIPITVDSDEALEQLDQLGNKADSLEKTLNKKKSIEVQIDEKTAKTKAEIEAETKEALQGVNWPAEFEALGAFLLKWVLAKAIGERVPLAITTAV